ncbi:MAG: nucleotidyltransferase domain-containing protein [Methanospirillum sp.]|uniref:nucleotidyltransferase domain-containing protein n=1 Tax=Methanospirillum sp. TaxID=45200 RepID=UPI002369ABEA|nr:nucleotidyltransferase domain-containing protein [Methanospirillum sp.]MDD1728909.1 nucleotidyltransferase domain-containing protein [Methanospirillum sp.]
MQINLVHPNRPFVVPLIEKYLAIVTNTYSEKISDIILFGSVARGEDTKESDIDLLIVGKKEDWQLERELIDLAYDIGLEYGVYLSVKYVSADTYNRQKTFTLFQQIAMEGVSLVP